ncbi:MAG TPA: polysaccharide biosynthesis tyrosine autokinase [Candidatus Handelsmanbacteria bacterium]|nr:polysaccharide biosynthesis tyrosine autokinase [Candidatus Handelsmanbacteria bacterium]
MAQYEVTLRDYWRILRRRKGVVIFTAFLLGFFSFVLAQIWQPIPEYTANAKIQIESNQSVASLYMESYGYSVGDQIETKISVIQSYPVIRRAAEVIGMMEGTTTLSDTTLIVLGLQGRIVVDQEGYSNILVIEATDINPTMAQNLANTLAEVYKQHEYQAKNKKARKTREFVEQQIFAARDSLAMSEDEAKTFREDHDLISIDAQASLVLGLISEAERNKSSMQQVITAIDSMQGEIKKEGQLTQKTLQGASREHVGNAFAAFVQQLNALHLERHGLLVRFTSEHPNLKQLDARVQNLTETMGEELKRRRKTLMTNFATLDIKLVKLKAERENLPTLGLALGRKERKILLFQEIVIVLEEELQAAKINEANTVESVVLMQAAIKPSVPNNPHNPVQRAVMGMVLGLVLGVVFAVIAETLDTSIGTIEDVQEYTETKVVGVIPFIRAESVEASMKRRGVEIEDERMLQRMAQLVTYFDPKSTLAETYRTLRTNIEFVTVEKGDKTMIITSSTSGEGKSTVTANLAMTMTQLGKRTLLVDSDLRKPTVARMFGLDKEPGLAEVIVGNYEWREVIRTVTDIVTGGMGMEDLMQTQGISNLHIITSGAIPPNPAELLNSGNMMEFIKEVSEVYDIVLFDAPPVLHVTDAVILGKKVDGALVIYKAGDIPRTSLKRTVNLLNSVEVDILGIVLNGIRADISADYYDFGYSAYYGYGTEEEEEGTWIKKARGYAYGLFKRGEEEDNDDDDRNGGDYDDAYEDEPVFAGQESGGGSGRVRHLLGTMLLAVVGGGMIWQSGYLTRPLGLIPVFASYSEATLDTPTWVPIAEPANEQMAPPPPPQAVVESSPAPAKQLPDRAVRPVAVVAKIAPISAPAATMAMTTTANPVQAIAKPMQGQLRSKPQPYALRIASYARSSKWAVAAVDQLREAGQHAFLVPTADQGGRERMVRLMVGGFPNWDAAYREGQRMQDSGQLKEFTVAYLPYAAELDSFAEFDQAGRVIAGLGEKSYFCYVQSQSVDAYRVLAGAFETDEEARAFLGEFDGARIVRR